MSIMIDRSVVLLTVLSMVMSIDLRNSAWAICMLPASSSESILLKELLALMLMGL